MYALRSSIWRLIKKTSIRQIFHTARTRSAPLDWRQLAFSPAAATGRRQSQPGANSDRRSGSNRALTTGQLNDPTLTQLSYRGGKTAAVLLSLDEDEVLLS